MKDLDPIVKKKSFLLARLYTFRKQRWNNNNSRNPGSPFTPLPPALSVCELIVMEGQG